MKNICVVQKATLRLICSRAAERMKTGSINDQVFFPELHFMKCKKTSWKLFCLQKVFCLYFDRIFASNVESLFEDMRKFYHSNIQKKEFDL